MRSVLFREDSSSEGGVSTIKGDIVIKPAAGPCADLRRTYVELRSRLAARCSKGGGNGKGKHDKRLREVMVMAIGVFPVTRIPGKAVARQRRQRGGRPPGRHARIKPESGGARWIGVQAAGMPGKWRTRGAKGGASFLMNASQGDDHPADDDEELPKEDPEDEGWDEAEWCGR